MRPSQSPAPSNESSVTVDAWAASYITADTFAFKLAPPPPPENFAEGAAPNRDLRPGRGPEFRVGDHGLKSSGKSALKSAATRARLVHTFLHHELQAAELMAWAMLAFPDSPRELKRGLVKILFDEVRHMNMYAAALRARGFEVGGFEVRDWFWERVPRCTSIDAFLATLGIGFEGANLDHAARFASRFRSAEDEELALIQERVGREEVPHVKFALRWFVELNPDVRAGMPLFEAFTRALPEPLSPMLMAGTPLARDARKKAGLDDAFMAELERCARG